MDTRKVFERLSDPTQQKPDFADSNLFINFVGDKPETSFYIGGVIREVSNADITIRTYTVTTPIGKIPGVGSSDLKEYFVGDNVLLLKKWDGVIGAFFWRDLVNSKKWIIVPVEFKRS